MHDTAQQVGDDDDHLEELRERERTELLHALKAKWDTVNKKYQLMVRLVEKLLFMQSRTTPGGAPSKGNNTPYNSQGGDLLML